MIRKPPFFISLFCAMLTASGMLPGVNPAQAGDAKAFDSLEAGLGYVVNTNRNDFHARWKPQWGAEGFIQTPFYYGDVQVGIRVVSYSRRIDGVPDFHSLFVSVGWGKRWDLPYNLEGFVGFSVGSDQMIFEEEDLSGSKLETESGTSFNARLSYPIYGKWAFNMSGNYTVILTQRRIKLAFLSAGISRSFSLPDWIKEFLR
ncbi:MAG: hypothetical protein GTO51_02945 [Candidatus Latescibacteria bacterium]|nr:hypothetical protein [Candidatus Latescibacterota bacterium]NIM22641.1 hypothetical protein [Candidatus Latescibacterota bacterium]NIM64930.1 hypothetical protein [Candidatus Latescibacterota bacterium]NIO01445.1 hypothetical protein [Candidatus Latescibacterota bacterium]NIO27955.1 hypothetical protein [Candidatus Latescibacterota bacterium]